MRRDFFIKKAMNTIGYPKVSFEFEHWRFLKYVSRISDLNEPSAETINDANFDVSSIPDNMHVKSQRFQS